MEPKFDENDVVDAPLTPPSEQTCPGSMVYETDFASKSASESLIDILMKKSASNNANVEKKSRKRAKTKRHNPKVLDPSKVVNRRTPKPRTPKPNPRATKSRKPNPENVKKNHKKENENGERKRTRKRKLNFESESYTLVDDGLNFQSLIKKRRTTTQRAWDCKKSRTMRQRPSFDTLQNLITMMRTTKFYRKDLNFPKSCKKTRTIRQRPSTDTLQNLIRATPVTKINCKDTKEKKPEVPVSTLSTTLYPQHSQVPVPSTDTLQNLIRATPITKINCEDTEKKKSKVPVSTLSTTLYPQHSQVPIHNIFSIQDELLEKVLEDFIVQKMKLLSIVDHELHVCEHKKDSKKFHKANDAKELHMCEYKQDPKKFHKATVDIDPETKIVWNLLMENEWSEEAESKALGDQMERMRHERNNFKEKVDDFLARMNVVQGDRTFTAWKGSVVDSVIGVMLTPNVSDHLSSSAFMAMRARYPPLSVSEQNLQFRRDEERRLMVVESSCMPEEPGNEPHSEAAVTNTNTEATVTSTDLAAQVTNKQNKKEKEAVDWDELRKQYGDCTSTDRTEQNADSVNWGAVYQATQKEIAEVIAERGMSNQIARRMKLFLSRLVRDHGSIDLEWLRKVPPIKAKDYLRSMDGLGLKSTECVRLLGLHFQSFPVDTNAGRFFVRVGWVPLKPLPESVQLHVLNQYPVLDSIQEYIWPRICDNNHQLLYKLHCHSVTVAKTFCTKTKPNCNQCPMRLQCKHYASACASSKLYLEGSEPKTQEAAPMLNICSANESTVEIHSSNLEPIIEFPPSPVAERPLESEEDGVVPPSPEWWPEVDGEEDIVVSLSNALADIEDMGCHELICPSPRFGSISIREQKILEKLRTVHQVYALPDSHPLLAEFENRVPEDPSPYLLAVWTSEECRDEPIASDEALMQSSSGAIIGQLARTIKGTILIPVRTANKGAFPLNGTYFQPNEVFADHASSRNPIDVPIEWLVGIEMRVLYCGTSITAICKGMKTTEVGYLFNRGYICTRGFDTMTGAAKLLAKRFHFCKSRPSEPKWLNHKKQSEANLE